jgi:peroxiredoxin
VSGVPDALQFTAPLVGGGTLDLASLAGPPVLLWFWAPF